MCIFVGAITGWDVQDELVPGNMSVVKRAFQFGMKCAWVLMIEVHIFKFCKKTNENQLDVFWYLNVQDIPMQHLC